MYTVLEVKQSERAETYLLHGFSHM